jgi:hypothetical protein
MPDSFGKRNRDRVKAEKAAARDARRIARSRRQGDRQSEPVDPFIGSQDQQIEKEGT